MNIRPAVYGIFSNGEAYLFSTPAAAKAAECSIITRDTRRVRPFYRHLSMLQFNNFLQELQKDEYFLFIR